MSLETTHGIWEWWREHATHATHHEVWWWRHKEIRRRQHHITRATIIICIQLPLFEYLKKYLVIFHFTLLCNLILLGNRFYQFLLLLLQHFNIFKLGCNLVCMLRSHFFNLMLYMENLFFITSRSLANPEVLFSFGRRAPLPSLFWGNDDPFVPPNAVQMRGRPMASSRVLVVGSSLHALGESTLREWPVEVARAVAIYSAWFLVDFFIGWTFVSFNRRVLILLSPGFHHIHFFKE